VCTEQTELVKRLEREARELYGWSQPKTSNAAFTYDNFARKIEHEPAKLSGNAVLRKKHEFIGRDMHNTLETLLDADMIGVRLPQTDQEDLRDFSKWPFLSQNNLFGQVAKQA